MGGRDPSAELCFGRRRAGSPPYEPVTTSHGLRGYERWLRSLLRSLRLAPSPLTVRRFSCHCLSRDGGCGGILRLAAGARRRDGCCERWGSAKVTVDDIATEAGCSRATALPAVPRRQGRPLRGAAPARDRGVLRRADRPPRRGRRLRGPLVRGVVARHPGAAGRRAPPADAGLASPARSLADLTVDGLPRIFASPTVVPHAVVRPVHRARAARPSWPSGWPASSSPTSSRPLATSTSATRRRPTRLRRARSSCPRSPSLPIRR